MKLRYSQLDVCQTGRWAYEIVKQGTPTGEQFGGRPLFTTIKTGEVFRDQKKAAARIATLNAAGEGNFTYLRTIEQV